MSNAAAGAGGVGVFENGGAGGINDQAGGTTSKGLGTGGAAGASPGASGGDGSAPDSVDAGTGGGAGQDNNVFGGFTGGNGGNGGNGGLGGTDSVGGGGGGSGGDGYSGYVEFIYVAVPLQGGKGGNGGGGGGGSDGTVAGGGGGGDGGIGLVTAPTMGLVDLYAGGFIVGGDGGLGGFGSTNNSAGVGGDGGDGGDGGVGLDAGNGGQVTNAGNISGGGGGNGGSGGTGGTNGHAGACGAGIIGLNLTVTNSGEIGGGHDNGGVVRGDAIEFLGGSNALTLSAGGVAGTISGNIAISGSLTIAGGTGTPRSVTLSGGALVFAPGADTVVVKSDVDFEEGLSGLNAGDTLDVEGLVYAAKLETRFTASATGGVLRVFNTANSDVVLNTIPVAGTGTSGVFDLVADGSGGTKIAFVATPPLGTAVGDVVTSSIPGSAAIAVIDRYNADYSLYEEATITKLSSGDDNYHFQGGSFFAGKNFASFDNTTTLAGHVTFQTLYNSAGLATQQTQFNADGSINLQDVVVRPAAGQVLYEYRAGSFFTGKTFLAFDNLTTMGGSLLDQLLYNRDSSHSWTAPGSGLTLTAVKNDTFNVTGTSETTRFNATGFGTDTFNGYKAGDVFSFSTSIFASYAALSSHVSGTSSAMITDTAGDKLTLSGVAANSLTSSMFKFS